MERLPKKICSFNLSAFTIIQIKTLSKIYNCSEEWVIECLVNEFYMDEKKRQNFGKQEIEAER